MNIDALINSFRLQSHWCEELGSPFYARLLTDAADDIERGGPVAKLLEDWSGNPVYEALPLRVMGGVHRLVLDGELPALAAFYPSVAGTPSFPDATSAFLAAIDSHIDILRPALEQQVQTNEVNRCAALLGGFLRIAAQNGLPMRLLELGASAGLNLLWDRYRYQLGEYTCGPPRSPVTIGIEWEGPPPDLNAPVDIVERSGTDIAPVNIRDDDQARRLESFVWADQVERLERLRGAIKLARQARPRVEKSTAARWLRRQLSATLPGITTVVFHSAMWWYVSEAEQTEIVTMMEEAGSAATSEAPVAWLSLEVRNGQGTELRLRIWPDGAETVLAYTDGHARHLRWVGGGKEGATE